MRRRLSTEPPTAIGIGPPCARERTWCGHGDRLLARIGIANDRWYRDASRLLLTLAFGFLGATVADLFMPVFSGHLAPYSFSLPIRNFPLQLVSLLMNARSGRL